jgi:hypothetical protein
VRDDGDLPWESFTGDRERRMGLRENLEMHWQDLLMNWVEGEKKMQGSS